MAKHSRIVVIGAGIHSLSALQILGKICGSTISIASVEEVKKTTEEIKARAFLIPEPYGIDDLKKLELNPIKSEKPFKTVQRGVIPDRYKTKHQRKRK